MPESGVEKLTAAIQSRWAGTPGDKADLSSVKSSEVRDRYYNELGATELACLWVLEHFGRDKTR